jgi:N-acetylmuramoyl-L-alanine amidase
MNARNIFITVTLMVLVVAGCQKSQERAPRILANEQMISVSELAARLGLRLDEQNDTFVVLKNQANTVLIFTYTDGRFFVNGQPIGLVGAVKRIAGTSYVSETLVSQIRPYLGAAAPVIPQTPTIPMRAHIAIDPGHGGRDPGTIGIHGTQEKDINLEVARRITSELQRRGLTVTMTRQRDEFIELESRADIANRRNVDLFVSIHADSAPNPNAQGFTLYVAEAASSEALRAARAIAQAMATTGLDSRGIRRNDYRVLVQTDSPAVLIELGYLSNVQDSARLLNSAFQDRLAAAIASGIADYLR